jgi:hypothetical protein
MGQSEVARIREQIECEYQASRRVFTNFTPYAQHAYVTKRQENIEACYQNLKKLVSPEEAIVILIQAEQAVYDGVSSSGSTS